MSLYFRYCHYGLRFVHTTISFNSVGISIQKYYTISNDSTLIHAPYISYYSCTYCTTVFRFQNYMFRFIASLRNKKATERMQPCLYPFKSTCLYVTYTPHRLSIRYSFNRQSIIAVHYMRN